MPRKRTCLPQVEWLPVTSHSYTCTHAQTHKCNLSIMMIKLGKSIWYDVHVLCMLSCTNNSGDELFSDTYPIKVVDDVFYEVQGKVKIYTVLVWQASYMYVPSVSLPSKPWAIQWNLHNTDTTRTLYTCTKLSLMQRCPWFGGCASHTPRSVRGAYLHHWNYSDKQKKPGREGYLDIGI